MGTKFTIPPDVNFADLKLSFDSTSGELKCEWAPIARVCEASGINPDDFEASDKALPTLLVLWYAAHLRLRGGAVDPVASRLHLDEALLIGSGRGFMWLPGRGKLPFSE
jgi:hypothetical protein